MIRTFACLMRERPGQFTTKRQTPAKFDFERPPEPNTKRRARRLRPDLRALRIRKWVRGYCLLKTSVLLCVPRGDSLVRLTVSVLLSDESDHSSVVVIVTSFP